MILKKEESKKARKQPRTTAQRRKNDEWFCSFCLTERPLIRRSVRADALAGPRERERHASYVAARGRDMWYCM